MPVKASELVEMLKIHIEKYGDGNVMIYDDYEVTYKTFDRSCISRNEGRFVIECHAEN